MLLSVNTFCRVTIVLLFSRFHIEDYNKPCPWYNAIMVLRILWLKDNKPDTWHLLDMLMDHLEDQKKESKKRNTVVDFIRKHCKLTQFSEEEIRHVIGRTDFIVTYKQGCILYIFRGG